MLVYYRSMIFRIFWREGIRGSYLPLAWKDFWRCDLRNRSVRHYLHKVLGLYARLPLVRSSDWY